MKPLQLFRVVTTGGTLKLWASSSGEAVDHALELCGPGATLIRCQREGDW
jgi:hypothetical protein